MYIFDIYKKKTNKLNKSKSLRNVINVFNMISIINSWKWRLLKPITPNLKSNQMWQINDNN